MREPLEVLFEREGLPTVDLPQQLHELYGGSIGFDEPRLYANFVSTIDGVVAIPAIPRSNALVAGSSDADRFVMGLLRAFADVVLVGAGTLASSPNGTWLPERVFPPAAAAFAELRRRLGRAERPEVAILTGRGSIAPTHPVLASGALVLTSEPGAVRLQGDLPEASTVAIVGEEPEIDLRRAVEALHERRHGLILSEAGPHTFGGLVAAGLVDELFLTISPLVAGDRGQPTRLGLAESVDLMPRGVRARLLGLRRHEEHLFLRYELDGRPAS
ncbi:MAG: dihydrofolate reductase family protein [Gaiellaceae bacterium]